MKKNLATLISVLVALAVVSLAVIQAVGLSAREPLPHARSEPHIQMNSNNNPMLDGTLGGYDLEQIQRLLEKPCARWYDAFIAAGWEPAEWRTARWVMFRESRCDQWAWNGQDAGLLQINKTHRPLIESYSLVFPDDLFNAETNLWIAHVLWLQYGWKPWTYKGVVPK
jgi:hypothetical protein